MTGTEPFSLVHPVRSQSLTKRFSYDASPGNEARLPLADPEIGVDPYDAVTVDKRRILARSRRPC